VTTHYFDPQGRAIILGKELGSGGEGAVFEIGGDSQRVAKIYHRAIATEKAAKLRSMARLAAQDLTRFASWPLDVLHNGNADQVAGIVLPRVRDHDEIHKLYSPAQRKIEYPDKDWSFLLHVAMNCAAAFDAIHQKAHVIGDVNQGNVLVSQRGTVFLIDCDSFQVNAEGRLFLCEVGVPQFTPPELQGQSFRGMERTANHDRFGLALIIFHLLFMGRHPFAGRFLGRGDMPIEQAIQEYRYAFSSQADRLLMAPPPQTLSLERIAPRLATLFEQAFARGSEQPDARPTAEQWHAELSSQAKQLQTCGSDRGHKYVADTATCAWCELMLGGAPNFFLSVTFRGTNPEMLNVTSEIRVLWRAIEAVPRPPQFSLPPVPEAVFGVTPTPPPPAVESAQALATMVRYVAIGSLFSTMSMLAVPEAGYVILPISMVFSLWWLVLFLTSGHRPERNRRRRLIRLRRSQLKHLQSAWAAELRHANDQFAATIKELSTVFDQIAKLKHRYDVDFTKLGRDLAERQRKAFLQSKFICDYKIDGISVGRQATLASYGIETAHDVEYNRVLAIPGMGPALTNTLCSWRSGIERQFTLNRSQGIPPAERHALLLKYAQVQQQLELKLRQGPDALQKIERDLREYLGQLTDQLDRAHVGVAQAIADLSVMRDPVQRRR